ncbi:hypothetical protein H1Q63_02085 [Desmonostoc muscorum CCALA 125]|nr:hypothetical protein [Desmonostoc muscorum CCALA 125]
MRTYSCVFDFTGRDDARDGWLSNMPAHQSQCKNPKYSDYLWDFQKINYSMGGSKYHLKFFFPCLPCSPKRLYIFLVGSPFITALSESVNKVTGFELGAVDYIT